MSRVRASCGEDCCSRPDHLHALRRRDDIADHQVERLLMRRNVAHLLERLPRFRDLLRRLRVVILLLFHALVVLA